MYAVIKTGGKQYRVAAGDVVIVEKLAGDAGETVQVGDVLMIGEEGKAPTVGTPVLETAAVTAEIIEQGRADKVVIFKKKRRHNYRRKKGHRQMQTVLRVTEISATGKKAAAPAKKAAAPKAAAADKPAAAKKAPAKKAAPKKAAKKTEE